MGKKRNIQSDAEAESNIRFARGFFPNVQTLLSYVKEINVVTAPHGFTVDLDCNNASDAAYSHVVNNLLIAGNSKATVPDSVVEGLRGFRVRQQDVLQQVIQNALQSSADGWGDQSENVLSHGFSISRPSGAGSRFRGLDSRAPSSMIEMLLSPPWERLFSKLGHVVVRYLLSSTVLLLPIHGRKKRPRRESNENRNSEPVGPVRPSMLQICGQMSGAPVSSNKNDATKNTVIGYRRNVLHRTARDKYLPLKDPVASTSTGPEGDNEIENLSRTKLQKQSLLNEGLPSMHFLQRLQRDRRSALLLYQSIFDVHAGADNTFVPNSSTVVKSAGQSTRTCPLPKRMKPLLPVLIQFITRTRARSFRRVLGFVCPLPAWVRYYRSSAVDVQQLTETTTNPKLVARFLCACVMQSFPPDMLGSSRNMDILKEGIHTFVRKRMRNESFNVASFFTINGFKTTDVPWLFCTGPNGSRVRNPTDLAFRRKKLERFLTWVFQGFLLSILLKSFYVTESAVLGQRILFYRKEIWMKLLDLSMKETLDKDRRLFEPISTDSLVSAIHNRDHKLANLKVGVSPCQFITCFHLRFVPKARGTRPIQRLHAKPWGKISKRLSGKCAIRVQQAKMGNASSIGRMLEKSRRNMKSAFSIAHKVLRLCCIRKPELLGSSVFGLDDIYVKLLRFKKDWVNRGRPPVFVACLDIAKSFDTVPLTFLAETVLPTALRPARFVLVRYAVVTRNESTGRVVRRFESHVCEKPGEESSPEKLYWRHKNAICIDLARVQILHRQELLDIVQDFLLNSVAILPRCHRRTGETPHARQIRGVGQGNPLSPILASLFYGYMERRKLKGFLSGRAQSTGLSQSNHSQIFMRQIDDSFFASTDQKATEKFAKRMTDGLNDASGFKINLKKTRFNYASVLSGQNGNRILAWCGLLIDTLSMEVRCDFSRYVPPRLSSLRESLSVDFETEWCRGLTRKAWTCFRPKIHPLLMDSSINSRRTVALNVYQSSLLVALKLCSHALAVEVRNSTFLLDVVQNAILRVGDLVRRTPTSTVGRKHNCEQPLSSREIHFLVVYAFAWAFSERFCAYHGGRLAGKVVSSVLKTSALNMEGEITSCVPDAAQMLFSVVECESNRQLWDIKL